MVADGVAELFLPAMSERLTPGASPARGQGVSAVSADVQLKTVYGKPVWKLKIPVISQPATSCFVQPEEPKRNHSNGTSQLKLLMKRCLTSKSAGPYSFCGSNGESRCGVVLPPKVPMLLPKSGLTLSSVFE